YTTALPSGEIRGAATRLNLNRSCTWMGRLSAAGAADANSPITRHASRRRTSIRHLGSTTDILAEIIFILPIIHLIETPHDGPHAPPGRFRRTARHAANQYRQGIFGQTRGREVRRGRALGR